LRHRELCMYAAMQDGTRGQISEVQRRPPIQFLNRLKNQTLAVLYSLFGESTVFCYLQGYDPEFAALSPGTYLMFAAMEDAILSGMKKFDLLRGEEGYKQHWRAQAEATYRITLTNRMEPLSSHSAHTEAA
jgi:CelD/BcsL family acetyltransferase involved in cellulose biosynthesis